jgi:membrane dipeptidase
MKENGGVVQTVAFRSYLNTEKNDARSRVETEIGKKIMDSLGGTWYEWKEARALNSEDREAFYSNYEVMSRIRTEKLESVEGLPPAVNVSDFVDHIDYLIEKIGINHVGISSDFDGGGGIEGWNDASETFNVTLELVKRNYSEEQIEKLWSGNLLRVLDEVAAAAKTIQEL